MGRPGGGERVRAPHAVWTAPPSAHASRPLSGPVQPRVRIPTKTPTQSPSTRVTARLLLHRELFSFRLGRKPRVEA
jgi:hypothetical protein